MKNLIATLCLVLVTEIVFSQNPGSFSKVTTPDIYMPAGSTAIPLHLKNIEGHLYWGTMQLDQGSDSIPWRITPSGIIIPKGSNNVVMPYGAYIAAGSGDVNDDGELDAGDKTIIRNDLRGATQMTNEQRTRADYNGNGRYDYGDIYGIAQMIGGIGTQADAVLNAKQTLYSVGKSVRLSYKCPTAESYRYNASDTMNVEVGGSMRIPLYYKLYFGGLLNDWGMQTVYETNPDSVISMYRSAEHELTIDAKIKATGGNSNEWNAKEPAISTGTTLQYWRGDKSWQTLPATVTPASNILSWDGTKYIPYPDKLVSDPGYPYFFAYNGTPPYKTASFTRPLTLDGQFRANSMIVYPSGTSNQNSLYLSGNSASYYGYQTNFQNYFQMVKDTGNVNYITAYAVRNSGGVRRSNPIWIGDNTTLEGRVNEQIIVDPENNRFDINMTKVRHNKGTTNKYLKLNANKEIEYVDLPAGSWTLGTGIQTSIVDTVKATVFISGTIKSTAIPGTDHSVSGDVVPLTANAASAIGDVVYINTSGKAQFCKADTISNCRYAMAVCAEASIAANGSGNWLTKGSIKDATWSWTVGGLIYVSTSGYSGATLTQSAPAGANNVIMPVGVALSSSTMYFFGNINSVEHQ